MHEIKHDYDEKYSNLLEGGITSYEGLKPDLSKGYDWKVKWGEPHC